GINQYRFLQPLKYAKRDAEVISTFLTEQVKCDRIFLFTDDSPPIGGKQTEPFRANLLRVLRQIFEKPFMKDGDNFWFFFSGHGIRHREQDYLMPLDGDPEDVENTGIPTHLITNYLRSCGADNVVLILDACRNSGKKSGEGIGRQTEAEARQTGVISIFSCSPDQYSYELDAIAQGAFTHALIEGLGIRGRCATVERLNQYLENRVPDLVGQYLGRVRQTPYIIAEPLRRSHLILMPQHASLADIATLKIDAYRAQMKQDWDLAQRLWIRVNAAASGQDMEAIEALQTISIQRHTRTTSPKPSSAPLLPPALSISPIFQKAVTSPRTSPVHNFYSIEINLVSHRSVSGTSQYSTGLQWTRKRFLTLAISAGVGVVGVTITNQSLLNFSTIIDYSKLERFLKAEQWQEADRETANLMLKVADREQEGWLDVNSIKNFPCEVLGRIDRLWINNSAGKFGFSVQKQIYLESCGGNSDGQYDERAWNCFGNAVGWRVNNQWISYERLTFNVSANKGHLPARPWFEWWTSFLNETINLRVCLVCDLFSQVRICRL
ncbi:MAG: transcriptional regulator, partial [Leptolyngbyaceae cyanobacterium RM2_2_4]|nr:transcriptional regulator [Leptolyngbyaceae cyanobacterium RM2_2_4]